MHTIRLRISDKGLKNFMWLLARFRSDEIQVIEENNEFLSVQKYLEKELHDLESGESELIPPEELDSHLENVIKKYED